MRVSKVSPSASDGGGEGGGLFCAHGVKVVMAQESDAVSRMFAAFVKVILADKVSDVALCRCAVVFAPKLVWEKRVQKSPRVGIDGSHRGWSPHDVHGEVRC